MATVFKRSGNKAKGHWYASWTGHSGKRSTEQLQSAIENTPVTRYRTSQDRGIAEGVLSRFVHGHVGLSIRSIDTLMEYLDLELVPHNKNRTKRGR